MIELSLFQIGSPLYIYIQFDYCRRSLDYQEILDALARKGIAIRVASPKLVMEEVCHDDVMVV